MWVPQILDALASSRMDLGGAFQGREEEEEEWTVDGDAKGIKRGREAADTDAKKQQSEFSNVSENSKV